MNIHTESEINSDAFTYTLNLNIIPQNQVYFGFGKVSVYVKYEIAESYRREHFWWGSYPEGSTVKTNYHAYKFLYDLDTFIYPNNTFGDTVTGIYSYGTFNLN